MPSFTKFFTLAACVVAALAVPACEDAKVVKSQSLSTAGGVITVNTFSCAPRAAATSKRGIVNVQGEICTNSCTDNAGNLPPIAADCVTIQQAVPILEGAGALAPTFTVGGYGQQNTTFGTCTMSFTNLSPNEVENDWQDFVNKANQAGAACFPPVQPFFSEGVCSAINGGWTAAAAHS